MKAWDHHIPLLCVMEPLRGYYKPDFQSLPKPNKIFLNKGYRNLAYLLNAYITNTNVTLIDSGGGSYTVRPDESIDGLSGYPIITKFPYVLNFGGSTNPHDVSRYELYSRYFTKGAGGFGWLVEESDQTRIRTWHRYAFPAPSKTVGEVGFYIRIVNNSYSRYFLLARVILDTPIEKIYNTIYEEGWEVIFPSNYPRWFLRAITYCSDLLSTELGDMCKDYSGADFLLRYDISTLWRGSTDVMIGRDNSPPSPTDYNLQNPIGSLGSQLQSVEIDTTLQECRIVRTGTYTPTTSETLGEVALYTTVRDVSGVDRKIMIARGIWDPPVTLTGGVTYTIGIVLKMG